MQVKPTIKTFHISAEDFYLLMMISLCDICYVLYQNMIENSRKLTLGPCLK